MKLIRISRAASTAPEMRPDSNLQFGVKMQIAPEILQELHVTCVRALRRYIVEANKTCRILADITTFPVSTKARKAILQQRQAENAAHESYQNARRGLFEAAQWNETA